MNAKIYIESLKQFDEQTTFEAIIKSTLESYVNLFFNKTKINQLTDGFKNIKIESFEEGTFPRKLYFVVNKKI